MKCTVGQAQPDAVQVILHLASELAPDLSCQSVRQCKAGNKPMITSRTIKQFIVSSTNQSIHQSITKKVKGTACSKGCVCAAQVSLTEVQNELAYSAAAYGILGKPGVVLLNCIIFMAVTSSGSGEMLAVSSLFTFDFYREYLRPRVRTCHLPPKG